MAKKPDQRPPRRVDDDYKAKYDALYAACGKANGKRKKLATTIARDIRALLKIICEPDPPGCRGTIPTENLAELLVEVQQANAEKQEKLQAIDNEFDLLMQQICDPDPPGCILDL
jgi:hypothetical protein